MGPHHKYKCNNLPLSIHPSEYWDSNSEHTTFLQFITIFLPHSTLCSLSFHKLRISPQNGTYSLNMCASYLLHIHKNMGHKAMETFFQVFVSLYTVITNLTVSLFLYTQLIIFDTDVKENALLSVNL